MTDWLAIWERKGNDAAGDYSLETLMVLDGYDTGAGKLDTAGFEEIPATVVRELGLEPGMRLLEVGCGAGAVLWCLRDSGVELYGVDFSAPLIEHARRAVPEASFAVSEATSLPFEADAVLCCGVFHYFPDLDYARRVLAEFERVAPVALVMDVPDAATREDSERMRAEAGSKPGSHLYYDRAFFAGASRLWTNDVPGYANASFRFNALLEFRPRGSVRPDAR